MSNTNTFKPVTSPDPLEKLLEEFCQLEAGREAENLEGLPEISPEAEAALLAEIEADLG